jgi:hypothetical protein
MKPESSLARRRHDRWRMVQRARAIFRRWDARMLNPTRVPFDAEKHADNMKRSSHIGCCSRLRETDGPTWRERRFALEESESIA